MAAEIILPDPIAYPKCYGLSYKAADCADKCILERTCSRKKRGIAFEEAKA
jgi:hypothetical protein